VDNEILRTKSSFDNELQAIEKESATVEAHLDVLKSHIETRNADLQALKEKASNATIEAAKVRKTLDVGLILSG